MSLVKIAAAAQASGKLPWQTCGVCYALDTIPDAEADALRDLLRSTLRYSEISDLIAADPDTPLQIDRDALSRHARGRCSAREVLRESGR